MMTAAEKPFPILQSYKGEQRPDAVNWSALNEEQAQKNHSQSLARLAERGGMSPPEIVANIERCDWLDIGSLDSDHVAKVVAEIEYKPNK